MSSSEVQQAHSLLNAAAVRERAHEMLEIGVAGGLDHWRVDLDRLPETARYVAAVIRDQSEARRGTINICNYDRRDRVDPSFFGIVSCDEASIFKSFTGVTRRELTDAHAGARFKLVASATPAPNDHMEFGSYSEFCEIMAANEMLSRFFINDTSTASQHWRLKGHAERPFWDWMASWARMAERPSDLGDDESDARYMLPGFELIRHGTKVNGLHPTAQ